MNKFIHIIVAVFFITNLNSQTKVIVPENALIKTGSAGSFKIGNQLPKNLSNGSINKKTIVGEEGEEIQITVISYNNQEFLFLIPEVDFNHEYQDFISEIFIKSPMFKTEKGIGVGNTIQDFIAQYPDFSIWYSYIGGRFIIDSDSFQRIQFIFEVDNETKNRLQNEICLDCEEIVFIDPKDISNRLYIKEIRLY